jgi:hypothetical protein
MMLVDLQANNNLVPLDNLANEATITLLLRSFMELGSAQLSVRPQTSAL